MDPETYARLDELFQEKRQFFWEKAEGVEGLEKILRGEKTFQESVRIIEGRYESKLSAIEYGLGWDRLDDYSFQRILSRSDNYEFRKGVESFARTVSLVAKGLEICADMEVGEIGVNEDELNILLKGWAFVPTFMGRHRRIRIIGKHRSQLTKMNTLAAMLDKDVARYFAPLDFRSNPGRFAETYDRLVPEEKEYVGKAVQERLSEEYAGFSRKLAGHVERWEKTIDSAFTTHRYDEAGFFWQMRKVSWKYQQLLPRPLALWPFTAAGENQLNERKSFLFHLETLKDALEDLSGESVSGGDSLLTDMRKLMRGVTSLGILGNVDYYISKYTRLALKVDHRIRLCHAERAVQGNEDMFLLSYRKAHPLEQEFVKRRLYKALDFGALSMSEDELQSILNG